MFMTIAIVTDSTSDLTPELCTQYGICSVPLYVHFNDKTYKDGLEITPNDLFEGMNAGLPTPTTSQPSPAEFTQVYQQALEKADQVISIHISSLLSGTADSAHIAAKEFGERVTVIDSKNVTLSLGMRAIRAAEMARQDKKMPEIVAAVESIAHQADLRFTVHTLDFLRINGRIGGAQALLGSLLNIKPILTVKEGRVETGGKVRGHKKAMLDLSNHTKNYLKKFGRSKIAFISTIGAEEAIEELRTHLSDQDFEDMGVHSLGAVIASHTGPGTFGLALEPVNP